MEGLSPSKRAELSARTAPRIVDPYVPHVPHPPQSLFLLLTHLREAFYGGAAGGGKSDALLMAALQYVDVPGYSALLLRRTFTDLTLPGALMDRANEWLQGTPAHKVGGGRKWAFPSGARLTFGYVQHHEDVEQYRSAEFQFIGVDELTQWDEKTYEFLFSRLRAPQARCVVCGGVLERGQHAIGHPDDDEVQWAISAACPTPETDQRAGSTGMTLADVPLRMRSASNPGGRGHIWVKRRFIDEQTRREGAAFVPALLSDNPSLNRTAYAEALSHLGPVERARLLSGDWDVSDDGGMFKRHWFNVVREAPAVGVKWCRAWDLAATLKTKRGRDPDWTAGALVGIDPDGQWWVRDMVRLRATPLGVEKVVTQAAITDHEVVRRHEIRMEEEGGSSGKNTIARYANLLAGHSFKGVRPTGSKEERARPFAAAAEAGNVNVVAGPWLEVFLDEFDLFPHGAHDDQVDAVSIAVETLAPPRRSRLIA